MNGRRGFFRNLIGASAAAVGTTALAKTEPVVEVNRKSPPDVFTWNEWTLRWSGYKEEVGSENITGQWTAKRIDVSQNGAWGFHGIVASTGGAVGPFHLGDVFNCAVMQGNPFLLATSTDTEKEAQKIITLKRLIEYLQKDPRSDWRNCFRCGPTECRDENLAKYGYGY